jgi:fucokinase
VTVTPVALNEQTHAELAERLVLVYTGQQRLAKNLLRNVMRRWMNRDPEMVWIQQEIARLALAMRDALLAGDLDVLGGLLGEHWTLNKRMDPGCTNPLIDDMFQAMAPLIRGGKLAGAGGGGFGFVVMQIRDGCEWRWMSMLRARYPGIRGWGCGRVVPEWG